MHSQDGQDSDKNSRRLVHIVDNVILESKLEYIDNVIRTIDIALTSPESAVLLSDLYDREHNLVKSDPSELIKSVLYREEEDIVSCTRYDTLLNAYIGYDIKKFFGLNISEFMDMPNWKMSSLIKVAEANLKRLSDELHTIESDVNELTNTAAD